MRRGTKKCILLLLAILLLCLLGWRRRTRSRR